MLVFTVLMTACTGGEAGDSTSSTGTAATSEPTVIDGRPAGPGAGSVDLSRSIDLALTPGEYEAEAFWSPFVLSVSDDGWTSRGTNELWAYFRYYEPGESTFSLDLSLFVLAPDESPRDMITAISASTSLDVVAEARPSALAGQPGWVVDLINTADYGLAPGDCGVGSLGYSRFSGDVYGERMLQVSSELGELNYFGIAACRSARIWAIDVAGSTITVIAGAFDETSFAELIAVAEELLAGIEFVATVADG